MVSYVLSAIISSGPVGSYWYVFFQSCERRSQWAELVGSKLAWSNALKSSLIGAGSVDGARAVVEGAGAAEYGIDEAPLPLVGGGLSIALTDAGTSGALGAAVMDGIEAVEPAPGGLRSASTLAGKPADAGCVGAAVVRGGGRRGAGPGGGAEADEADDVLDPSS